MKIIKNKNKNSRLYKITNSIMDRMLRYQNCTNRIILMTAKPVSIKRPEFKSI